MDPPNLFPGQIYNALLAYFRYTDQLDFQKAGQSIIKDKVNSDIISALGMTGQVAWDRFNADDYLFAKQ